MFPTVDICGFLLQIHRKFVCWSDGNIAAIVKGFLIADLLSVLQLATSRARRHTRSRKYRLMNRLLCAGYHIIHSFAQFPIRQLINKH